MKNFKFNLFYLIGLFLVFQSCTNELDVTPEDDDDFLSEDFFATPDAYKKGLAGVYGNLSLTGINGPGSSFLQGIDPGTSQYGRCLWYMQSLASDEAIWSYEGDGDPGVREIQRNIWTTENPILLGMFSRAMVQVALVNEYLRQTTPDKLADRNVTDATLLTDIELYRKEARVLRAMAYYHLMDLYGKAPFVTENDPINFAGPEYNREQLFAFIENELNSIVEDLKAPRTNEYGRLDQATAWMILAKIYLNAEVYIQQNKYNECITQCNKIINSAYVLENNYLDNFKADNNTSTEIIFALQSDGVATQNYGPTTVMINGSVGSLEQNGTDLGVSQGGWGGAIRLRKQFVQKFDGTSFSNDERNTILPPGPRPIEITNVTNQSQGYILAKFSNKTTAGVAGVNSTFVDTDFPLFRLADAYLMYAEATRRGGNGSLSQAVDYINDLRERANNSPANNITESQMTLEFILDERLRELYWEAHRRQDLIRFNRYTSGSYNWAWKGNAQNGIALPNHLRVYPLPSASVSANPNLTQNPGY